MSEGPLKLPLISHQLVLGRDRAAARAMLRAVGLEDDDFGRPLIGIANTWTDTTPCNVHLRYLGEWVKEGVREAGGVALQFNTIAVSDGITMGTAGMRASLVSREVVADSIELVGRAYFFDGVVSVHVFAIPIRGRPKSSSSSPTARSIARAAARSRPRTSS